MHALILTHIHSDLRHCLPQSRTGGVASNQQSGEKYDSIEASKKIEASAATYINQRKQQSAVGAMFQAAMDWSASEQSTHSSSIIIKPTQP
jgi:hypothetical protein